MQVVDDRYRLHELLLAPSHGEVYVSYDLISFTTKNLWIMPPARRLYATSFISACNIVQKMSERELPKIFSSGIDPTSGNIYVVYEHFQASSLYDLFQNNQKMNYKEVVGMLVRLLHVIKFTESYVSHGRINPKNVLVRDGKIQLLGFGLSYLQKVSDINDEMRIYLSPEQLSGEKGDYLSDLYSIGMVFFRSLFGFATNKHEDMVAQMEEFIPANDSLNYSYPWHLIKATVLKILSESPSDRKIPNDSDNYKWVDAVEL
jgi:serine/threonine-protein kinase